MKTIILRLLLSFLFCFTVLCLNAQDMDKEKLKLVIAKNATILKESGNTMQFSFNDVLMILVYDEQANRMRVITPVVEEKELKKKDLITLLEANYHSALDAKYALNDGYLWSTYIHPLKELQEDQVVDALHQVRNLLLTYGTYYTSTNLTFGK